jgi:hypothetical protein
VVDHRSEEAAARLAVFQRWPRFKPGGGADLHPDAVGIGEKDAAGTHAWHVRQDLVVYQRDAEVGQPGRGGFDIARRRDVERQVVQAGTGGVEGAGTLLPLAAGRISDAAACLRE